MKTIGIIGTRSRDTQADFLKVEEAFFKVYEEGDMICSGGCPKGGDRFAEIISNEYGIPIKIHKPDKSKLDPEKMKINPRWAYAEINYARNTLVAQDSNIVIACVTENRKGGTEDTIKKYIKFWEREPILV